MGRTFHYCKAGGALPYVHHGLANANTLHEGNSYGAVLAGTKTITVADTTGTLDQYKDGILTIFSPAAAPILPPVDQMLRIKSNTATSSGYVTLTLKDPLLYDVPNGTFCGWYPNIYGNVQSVFVPTDNFASFVCVGLIVVTLGYHFWGQTYGFCHGPPYGDPFGKNANERDLYFWIDGSLTLAETVVIGTNSHQRAGYLLPKTSAEGGDQAYMLQLEA
ncbi:hypothetical protein ES703_115635 [subsurface metagenome]